MHSNGEKRIVAFPGTLINRLKGMLIFDAETDFVRPGIVVRRSGPDVPAYADAAQLCTLSAFITIAVVLYMSVRFKSLSVRNFLMPAHAIVGRPRLNILADILCRIEIQVLGKLAGAIRMPLVAVFTAVKERGAGAQHGIGCAILPVQRELLLNSEKKDLIA